MKTRTVQLGDICEFLDHKRRPVSEELRKPGPYPYYGANGQQGWIDDFIFDEPLVLLAEDGGHFGSKTNQIAYKITGRTWVNNHAHVLRPTTDCDIDYLTHALSFYDVSKIVSGTTRPKLTKGNAEIIRLPLPSLPDQRRIAAQLDQADRLRRTRRYALELSDSFLHAAFTELFGDPGVNPRGLKQQELGQVASLQGGFAFNSDDYSMNGVRLVKIANVHFEHLTWAEASFVPQSFMARHSAFSLRAGDLLIALTRPVIQSLNTVKVARVRALDVPCLLNQRVARFLVRSESVDSCFLEYFCYTDYFKRKIDLLCSESLQPNISTDQIEEILLSVPSLERQSDFANLVTKHERLRDVQRESLRQAEHLFRSQLHQVFNQD